jgi:hypothetical protein
MEATLSWKVMRSSPISTCTLSSWAVQWYHQHIWLILWLAMSYCYTACGKGIWQFSNYIEQWNFVVIFNLLLQNEWTLNAMLFHIHFITSVYFISNSMSLRCCPSLHTHSSKLAHRFPSACLTIFCGIADSCFQIAHFRFEVPPKEITTGREIRWMCRPWKLTAQWNNVLWKHFPSDLHGCSRCMGSCNILLEPYGWELNSTMTQVLVRGSSLIFQHNEQMWL